MPTQQPRQIDAASPPTPERDKWYAYKDKHNKWRWRRVAINGRIVGASTQGYNYRADMRLNAIRNGMPEHILMKEPRSQGRKHNTAMEHKSGQ